VTETLVNFLIDVAADPAAAARFTENPHAAIAGLDLTEAERDALLARDSNRLRTALRASADRATDHNQLARRGRKKKSTKKKSGGSRKQPASRRKKAR
jgi:hypothetical protein